jgi:predicted site-specific integrase-resolvase
MKLSKWAKKYGLNYQSALRMFKSGKIENAVQDEKTKSIYVKETLAGVNEKIKAKRICIYARVSNQSRKKELQYQVDRLVTFANASGLPVDKIYKEVASGMNDKRKQLCNMLDSEPTHIIVEHKDRLTRFGFNYLEMLLSKLNCEIIVMNRDSEDETDLMKDLVSIITSFCCRLYGLRRGQNKAKLLKEELSK